MTEEAGPDTEELKEEYELLLETIRRNTDPNTNTVLLVDDERGIRKKVARDVHKFAPGALIFEAANGKEALDKLQEIRRKFYRDPLLMVLDLEMPVMDGWKVIEALKENYERQGHSSGVPIVVLSSSSGERGVLLGKKSVHDGKPGYTPLVTVAKEACVNMKKYEEKEGEGGLVKWLEFFLKSG